MKGLDDKTDTEEINLKDTRKVLPWWMSRIDIVDHIKSNLQIPQNPRYIFSITLHGSWKDNFQLQMEIKNWYLKESRIIRNCWKYHTWSQIFIQRYSNKNSMVLVQKRHVNPYSYGHIVFDKEFWKTNWVKDHFCHNWCCLNLLATFKRIK